MAHLVDNPEQVKDSTKAMASHGWVLLLVAIAIAGGAFFVPDPRLQLFFYAAAGSLVALTVVLKSFSKAQTQEDRGAVSIATHFADRELTPGFATDRDGRVIYQNAASEARFEGEEGQTLVRALGELFANPSAIVTRLQNRTESQGAAHEDIVTRRGHVRVSVHRFAKRYYYWRFDEIEDRTHARGAETLSLPVLTVGRNGTVLFVNEAARRILGGRPKNLQQVYNEGEARPDGTAMVMGVDGPLRVRLLEVDGPTGRKEVYFFPHTDVQSTEAMDAQFFDALPVALLKINRDGAIAVGNRQARDLLGRRIGNVDFADCVHGLGRSVHEWIEDFIDGRSANHPEILKVARDDKEVFVQISLERIAEAGSVSVVAVMHDVTELKSLEAQFVQSQKMQAIGQLAGGIAHDFNNLLTAISGHCDLLLVRRDQGDPDYADLVQIHQNANRAASLVGQLLAFSRKQTLRPEELDIRDTLTDLTHLLNRLVGETVTLTLSHDPSLGHIRADKRQLEQVIMNLVVNARDAMPMGGEIRIETARHHLQDELQRDRAVVPQGDYVLVRVIDEGDGIAPDRLNKIFEPFYTTKGTGKGTGLGLSMAYGIIKQSGGFIFVDSAVGSGSCFTLYFPERPNTATVAPADSVLLPEAAIQDVLLLKSEDEVPDPVVADPKESIFVETLPFVSQPRTGAVASDDISGVLNGIQSRISIGVTPPVDVVSEAAETADHLKAEPLDTPEVPDPLQPLRAIAPFEINTSALGDAGTAGVILLVEDEAPVRAFASRALQMRGFTVLEASSAEEALERLEGCDVAIDVFVTDVVMPGMDGPTWVQKALKVHPDTRVVFVSGYAEESFTDTQAKIPNSVFLPKPFSLNELTTTVSDQIR